MTAFKITEPTGPSKATELAGSKNRNVLRIDINGAKVAWTGKKVEKEPKTGIFASLLLKMGWIRNEWIPLTNAQNQLYFYELNRRSLCNRFKEAGMDTKTLLTVTGRLFAAAVSRILSLIPKPAVQQAQVIDANLSKHAALISAPAPKIITPDPEKRSAPKDQNLQEAPKKPTLRDVTHDFVHINELRSVKPAETSQSTPATETASSTSEQQPAANASDKTDNKQEPEKPADVVKDDKAQNQTSTTQQEAANKAQPETPAQDTSSAKAEADQTSAPAIDKQQKPTEPTPSTDKPGNTAAQQKQADTQDKPGNLAAPQKQPQQKQQGPAQSGKAHNQQNVHSQTSSHAAAKEAKPGWGRRAINWILE